MVPHIVSLMKEYPDINDVYNILEANGVKIIEDEDYPNLVMFTRDKQAYISQDADVELVSECNGIIFDKLSRMVESYGSNGLIDSHSSEMIRVDESGVQDLPDIQSTFKTGVLLKYTTLSDGTPLVSTNSTIDASKSSFNCANTFSEFIDDKVYSSSNHTISILVEHPICGSVKSSIRIISIRNKETFKLSSFPEHIKNSMDERDTQLSLNLNNNQQALNLINSGKTEQFKTFGDGYNVLTTCDDYSDDENTVIRNKPILNAYCFMTTSEKKILRKSHLKIFEKEFDLIDMVFDRYVNEIFHQYLDIYVKKNKTIVRSKDRYLSNIFIYDVLLKLHESYLRGRNITTKEVVAKKVAQMFSKTLHVSF